MKQPENSKSKLISLKITRFYGTIFTTVLQLFETPNCVSYGNANIGHFCP